MQLKRKLFMVTRFASQKKSVVCIDFFQDEIIHLVVNNNNEFTEKNLWKNFIGGD